LANRHAAVKSSRVRTTFHLVVIVTTIRGGRPLRPAARIAAGMLGSAVSHPQAAPKLDGA